MAATHGVDDHRADPQPPARDLVGALVVKDIRAQLRLAGGNGQARQRGAACDAHVRRAREDARAAAVDEVVAVDVFQYGVVQRQARPRQRRLERRIFVVHHCL